jgi:hypothetical protein
MRITSIRCFGLCPRDRDGSVTSPVCSPQRRAYHALRRRKCLLESVNCIALAIIGTLLNKLMGMTKWAQNVGCLGSGVGNRITFSMRYFRSA